MVNALPSARRGVLVFIAMLALPVLSTWADNPPATPTTSQTPALTERQASLLMQLAEAEANIKTINKALVLTGYKVGLAYEQIESSQGGNELMDRKGGGPVGWEQFYGKTASNFYYHSSEQLHLNKGGGNTTLDYQANGSRLTRINRPPQFDFIYRANDQQIARAKDQIASLSQNQAGLLARRWQHEMDESRLWAVFSWEQVRDREIPFRPLYRFKLQSDDESRVQLLRGPILYLRTADKALATALDSIDTDQNAAFFDLQQRTKAAYAVLQQSMADTLSSPGLSAAHAKDGEEMKALCKQLTEECTVITDNYKKALESDKAREDSSKLAFRGQLQSSLASLPSMFAEIDERLTKAADSWHVTAVAKVDSPDDLPVWPQRNGTAAATAGPAPIGVPTADGQSVLATMSANASAILQQTDDGVRIAGKSSKSEGRVETTSLYAAPLVITAVVKADSKSFHLFFRRDGMVAFNWGQREGDLHYQDPRSGRAREVADQGHLPKDTWVTVRWVISDDGASIDVDGVQRATFKANYQGLSGRIGVGVNGANSVAVRSLVVTPGPAAISAPPSTAAN